MTRFVTAMFQEVVQTHITETLMSARSNQELYLNTLSKLYADTTALSSKLAGRLKLTGDNSFLLQLIKQIFGQYLSKYIE